MLQPLARVALGQFAQIKPGTKVVASAIQHSRFGLCW